MEPERLDERGRVAVPDLSRDRAHGRVREQDELFRSSHPHGEDVLAHGGVADSREDALQLALRRERDAGDAADTQQSIEVVLDVRRGGMPNCPVGSGRG